MDRWSSFQLSELALVKGRVGWKGYKTSDLRESGPIVFSGTEVKSQFHMNLKDVKHLTQEKFEESPEIILKDKDLLVSTRGTLGEIGFYRCEFGPATINPSLVILSDYKGVPEFLYYFLVSSLGQEALMSISSGSTVPAIYQADLKKIEIPHPPLPEQQAIAEVLSSLDDKIDLLHRNNKTLEEMAETLFRQWFVEGNKEVSNLHKLGDFIKVESGYSYRSVDLNPSSTALVTLKNFNRNGGFRLDGFKEYSGRYKLEQVVTMGDLVVAHTDITQEADVLGNPAIVIDDGRYDKLVISTDLVKVISTSFLSKPYLYYLMRQADFKHYCLGASNGTTVMHLSKKALPEYDFYLPEEQMVKKFTSIVEPLFEKIGENIKQINQLQNSRDTLLPKLMSGQVRVDKSA
jgi:type I restriction enzyme S subunit